MSVQIKSLTLGAPQPDTSLAAQNDNFNVIPTANVVFDLYIVPTGKTAIVKGIRFVNVHSDDVTLNVYFMRPNASGQHRRRQLSPVNVKLPAGFSYIEDSELTFEAGDRVQAKADVANVIQYLISGVEREVT